MNGHDSQSSTRKSLMIFVTLIDWPEAISNVRFNVQTIPGGMRKSSNVDLNINAANQNSMILTSRWISGSVYNENDPIATGNPSLKK